MEKRVDSVKRSTTFSKRRHGLFNKVLELFLFCGSEVAVFVSFPSNNRRNQIKTPVAGTTSPDKLTSLLRIDDWMN
ncbi:hypothetical protein LINPERHAP2_LOCUS7382 [Linum perenne]